MNNSDSSQTSEMFQFLQNEIEKAEKENKPIKDYVEKQIDVLQKVHDEFIEMAKAEGYEMNNSRVGEIEVQQYAVMKRLAQNIGLPVEKYDNLIKEVRIRIFGEENYKNFFE